MKILYIGDIMGRPGVQVVRQVLPQLKAQYHFDLVIAQSENVNITGKSMSPNDMKELQEIGVQFFTGGNHTPKNDELLPLLKDDNVPVIGPANMVQCPGKGYKFIDTPAGRVLIVSLLGQTVGTPPIITNPLEKIDAILHMNKDEERVATVVDFHGDFSSEKRVIGYYLDGKVSAVVGDHWHVPTADAMVLPKGTAHITDVGMCGTMHGSLGVKVDVIIDRWRNGKINKNEMDVSEELQFNAVVIETNSKGLADSISPINLHLK